MSLVWFDKRVIISFCLTVVVCESDGSTGLMTFDIVNCVALLHDKSANISRSVVSLSVSASYTCNIQTDL